jgi:hypothetical protein
MRRMAVCLIVLGVFLLSHIVPVIAPEGPQPSDTSGSSGGGGGGGSKQIDIDRLIKTVQDGKKNKPAKFEELRTILWKDPITSEEYKKPVVLMYYKGNNTTISRNQPLEIITIVTNNNPLEMRRMLDLYLEVKEPGSNKYERLNTWPEKIQTNEYNENTNTTFRIWGMLPSFAYLKDVGEVKVRANVSDGVYKWSTASYSRVNPPYYSELVFNVTNSLPKMSNISVTPSGLVRYNDPIEYRANIEDADGDMLNVTLHILDKKGSELKNETLNMKQGAVSFKANEYGFFSESDAGKNFTYYYSFDDGINHNRTMNETGPSIRRGPKLYVDKLNVTPESSSSYWWNWYNFNVRAKNLNPEEYDVIFTLFTKTENGGWNVVESKTAKVGNEPQMIYFNKTKPFTVANANSTFLYRIKLSENDQTGKDLLEAEGPRINAKILPYSMIDLTNPFLHLVPIFSIISIVFMALLVGYLVERRSYR